MKPIILDARFADLLAILHRGGQHGYFWRKGQGSSWWNGDGPPAALPAANDLYFGVHPASAAGSRGERATLGTVAALNCLFAEFDAKDFGGDKLAALAHIHELELPPSVIIDSGGGYHCYWLLCNAWQLHNDAERERARELQARWVAFVGGDPGAKDLARVLRVPGTRNTKYSPPRPVVLERCDLTLRYDLGELAALAPAPPPAPPAPPPPPPSAPTSDRRAAYGQKALAEEIARVALARSGTRNDTLNNAAFTLGRKVAAGILDEHQVEQALIGAAAAAGLPAREAAATVRSGLRAGIAEGAPANLPDFDAPALASGAGSTVGAAGTTAAPAVALARGFVLRCLKEEEAGDAQLFTELHQGRIVYDRAAGAWYEFVGHAWQRLGGPPRQAVWGRVAAAYMALAAELQGELEKAAEDDQKTLAGQIDALLGRAKQLRRLNRCNNVLTFAGDMGLLGITGEEWDRDPWLLGVQNGVIDLRTGEHRAGSPGDYIRTTAPTSWEGLQTPAPRWERFISEVMSGEADRVAFLHRALGYALNGTTREHMLVLLVGEQGRNGKGVLFGTLRRILGDYAGAVSSDVIIGQQHRRIAGSAQPHLMELRGKRLAYTSETADGDQMSAAQVKLITGGDTIIARDLYEKAVSFAPSHTLFVATNRRPHAPADDDALWERVKVLEFKTSFKDEPVAPNERQRDPKLGEALAAEAPGILAWLVRGHLAYLAEGLIAPASVKLARDAYRKGESVEPFIAACCVEWDGGDAEAGALWDAYRAWCEAEGLRPKTQTWFGRQLAARYEKGRTSGGRACYYGVSLERVPARVHNPSEGVTTPQTEDAPDELTRFSEGFEPISEKVSCNLSHEGDFTKMAQTLQTLQPAEDDPATGPPVDTPPPGPASTWPAVRVACSQGRWETAHSAARNDPAAIAYIEDQKRAALERLSQRDQRDKAA